MSSFSTTAFDELLDQDKPAKYAGHGEHWRVFFDDMDELVTMLPLIAEAAKPLMTCADDQDSCPLPFPDTEPVGNLLVWPNSERGMIQIHTVDPLTNEPAIASAYPWLSDGITHMTKIEALCLWPDRLEALVRARIGDGMAVTFFDPLFVKNRIFYRKGGFYPMVFSAIAYEFRVVDVNQIPAGFQIDAEEGACRLVQDIDVADHYLFIGKVVDVKTVRFFDTPVFLVRLTIARMVLPFNEPVDIEVVVTDEALGLSGAPEPDDTVYGKLWLTAYLRKPANKA